MLTQYRVVVVTAYIADCHMVMTTLLITSIGMMMIVVVMVVMARKQRYG
jgi:hypothetical protein